MTLEALTREINANLSSSFYLTSEVVRRFKQNDYLSALELVIVNISSLAAIQPFPTWSVYSAGKAGREMYHKILAEENKNSFPSTHHQPAQTLSIRVLNYAPGPLDTDMQLAIREEPLVDKDTQVSD